MLAVAGAAHHPRARGAHHRPPGARRSASSLEAAAANTDDTALIAVAAEGVEAVLAEGLEHHLFLGRVLGKVRSMTTLVVLSVVDIVLLIAGPRVLPVSWAASSARSPTTSRSAATSCAGSSRNAEPIVPGVAHINRTGGVVAGALPLLYGMAEGIVAGATYQPTDPTPPVVRPPPSPPRAPAVRGWARPSGTSLPAPPDRPDRQPGSCGGCVPLAPEQAGTWVTVTSESRCRGPVPGTRQ